MHIAVKYENHPEILERTPIFATTNNALGGFLPEADRATLQSRTKTFNLTKEISSTGDRSNVSTAITQPPDIITSATWWEAYNRNLPAINDYVRQITGQYRADRPTEHMYVITIYMIYII